VRRSEPHDNRLFDPTAADELLGEITESEWNRLAAVEQIITLSWKEHELLSQRLEPQRLVYIPLTCAVRDLSQNSYARSPFAVIGPNAFNQHGFELFRRTVLPLVRRRLPSFSLDVGGVGSQAGGPCDGIRLLGQVADLEPIYRKAAFAVCLAPLGTGQQYKIIEAMAHGLPVIAWQSAARGTLITEGETGYAPRSPEEWCDRISQLMDEPELCRELGSRAHAAAAAEYAKYQTLPGLLSH
jgi:hypothetical protein